MIIQKTLLTKASSFVMLMMVLSACNEQEFYEKSYLEGAGVERSDDREGHRDADDGLTNDATVPNAEVTDPAPVPAPDNPVAGDTGDSGASDSQNDSDDGNSSSPSPVADDAGDDQGQNSGDVASDDQGQDYGDDASDDQGQNSGDVASDDQGQDYGDDASDDQGQNSGDVASDDQGQDYGDDASDDQQEPAVELVDKKDKFEQRSQGQEKVDILWVVDDSGSMRTEQASLAYNFNAFILDFLNQDVDFNMGITTTDATARGDGKWHGYYKHLTREAAQKNEDKFLRDFKRTIRVGTRGSPIEMGLHSGVRFLQRYANRKSLPFVRPDAYLVVVILSDEDDQSPESVEHYVDAFKSFKGDQSGLFKLYSIVVKKPTGIRWEEVGERYIKASEMSNGVSAHIKDDFYQVLRNMGSSIVNLTKSFALSDKPYGGELKVFVDDELADNGWSYDAETSSIRFNDDAIPRTGAAIEVHYQVEKND